MGRPEKGGWLAFVMDLICLVISTPLPLSLCCKEKKKINTSDQWLQRFSLSSAPFLTGCHSPLATQTCLIPTGDSYSLPDFQLSAESTALSLVHFEGLWQEAMLCFRAAERKDRSSRSTRKKRRSGVVLWRGLPAKTGDCKGCAQEIIKQQLVKGLSCSPAVKGPWWCDTRLSRWMWLLALVIDSPILFYAGRLSSTGSKLNGGLAFERKPRDLLAD